MSRRMSWGVVVLSAWHATACVYPDFEIRGNNRANSRGGVPSGAGAAGESGRGGGSYDASTNPSIGSAGSSASNLGYDSTEQGGGMAMTATVMPSNGGTSAVTANASYLPGLGGVPVGHMESPGGTSAANTLNGSSSDGAGYGSGSGGTTSFSAATSLAGSGGITAAGGTSSASGGVATSSSAMAVGGAAVGGSTTAVHSCPEGFWGPDCDRCVVRVSKDSASDAGPGGSWATAFKTIQSGINQASARIAADSLLESCEVWVKQGVYLPSLTDSGVSFELAAGVSLLGGFRGTEESRDQRDWATAVTTLSGDLKGDDVAGDLTKNRTDNSKQLLSASFFDEQKCGLDGFTLTASGQAISSAHRALIELENCTFKDNSDNAISISFGSLTATNCSFSNNVDAIYMSSASASFSSCEFSNNTGETIHLGMGELTVSKCRFEHNSGGSVIVNQGDGGGTIINSVFRSNQGVTGTIGTVTSQYAWLNFIGSLFWGNSASERGGCFRGDQMPAGRIRVFGSSLANNSAPAGSVATMEMEKMVSFTNSILWGNGSDPVDGTADFTNTIVPVGITGTGVINQDPRFVSISSGDLHLGPGSPAIDKGDNSLTPVEALDVDLDDNPRITGSALDMGAYESVTPK